MSAEAGALEHGYTYVYTPFTVLDHVAGHEGDMESFVNLGADVIDIRQVREPTEEKEYRYIDTHVGPTCGEIYIYVNILSIDRLGQRLPRFLYLLLVLLVMSRKGIPAPRDGIYTHVLNSILTLVALFTLLIQIQSNYVVQGKKDLDWGNPGAPGCANIYAGVSTGPCRDGATPSNLMAYAPKVRRRYRLSPKPALPFEEGTV
jgi:hypothetical protein